MSSLGNQALLLFGESRFSREISFTIFSAMKMSSIRCACGLVAFFTVLCFVVSDDSEAGGQHNPLHDSKVTHDKE